MAANDNAKLLRLRQLALEIVELTQDLEPEQPPKPSSSIDAQPTIEDFIELARIRERRRGRRTRG